MTEEVINIIQDTPQEIKRNIPDINPLDLIKLWDETFNIFSFNNPEYSRACLHLTLGQLLKNCRIKRNGTNTDPRISILYLKPPFSGGSAGFDMVASIFRSIGLRPQKITDSSDAALIGSFEKVEDCYVEIKGILDKSRSDLVYWGEASVLFKKNIPAHQIKTRDYIQMGLNPMDSEESHFNKPLKGGTITCDSEFSLLCVTYPPNDLNDNILNTGFVQRFCFISKTLDIDGRIENASEDIKRYAGNIDVNAKMDEIVKILKVIKQKYPKDTAQIFNIDEEGLEYFQQAEKELLTKFKNSNERIKTHMGSILTASVRRVSSIALHHAVLRLDNKITKEDIKYAFDEVIIPQSEMIHEYLESKMENQVCNDHEEEKVKKVRYLYNKILQEKKVQYLEKKIFLDVISLSLSITSSKSIYGVYNMLLDKNIIDESEKKNVRFKDAAEKSGSK